MKPATHFRMGQSLSAQVESMQGLDHHGARVVSPRACRAPEGPSILPFSAA